MIRSLYRSSQGTLAENLAADQLRQAIQDEQGVVWLDIVHVPAQREEVARVLKDLFPFHPLTLDDALHQTHVPRLDNWEQYLYVVLHALVLEVNRSLDQQELDVFLGRNYLVTLHEEPIRPLDHVWEQCRRSAERRMASGADHLLYVLLDEVVADFMPVVDGLDEELDELEDEIFQRPRRRTIGRIFRLRRTLLLLRRVLGAMREVLNKLARDDYAVIDATARVYFRDVYDHLVRLYDIGEGLRDVNAGALDSYLSVSSSRINEVMRTLTVVTVLFMPISFLAGFFGMNFFGDTFNIANPLAAGVLFWLCMAAMALCPPAMIWWMRRRGWLRSAFHREKE